MSVFNVGTKEGLAGKISAVPGNIGVRIVEVGSLDADVDDCRINLSKPEYEQTATVRRLTKVLGCPVEIKEKDSIGDLELLIKNVKI